MKKVVFYFSAIFLNKKKQQKKPEKDVIETFKRINFPVRNKIKAVP